MLGEMRTRTRAVLVLTALAGSCWLGCTSFSSSSTPDVPDDAGDAAPASTDAGPGDADAGAAPCDAVVCDDFEQLPFGAPWASRVPDKNGTLSLAVNQARSPTHSMLATALPGTSISQAFFRTNYSPGAGMSVHFFFLLTELPAREIVIAGIRTSVDRVFLVKVKTNGELILYEQSNTDAGAMFGGINTVGAAQLGEWRETALDVSTPSGASALRATLTIDTEATSIDAVYGPATQYEGELGVLYVDNGAGVVNVYFDDVVIRSL